MCDFDIDVVFLEEDIEFEYVIVVGVGEVDLLAGACLDVEFVVAEVEVVHAVADVHDILLHHLLSNYQLPEVNHALELLNHVLKSHHLQVLVKLYVLNDERETNGFAGAEHQVLEHVDYLS